VKTFVIKLGGALLDEPQAHAPAFDALATCLRAAPAVVVHGGGKAVDRQLDRLGMPSRKQDGIRVTPPEQMDQITGVLAGCMNARLVGLLLARGVRAVGLTLGDAGVTRARVTTRYAFDAGRVGEITSGDPGLLHTLLQAGFTPVLSSIALDSHGETLNVNADEAAAALARLLPAERLVLLTDVPGVKDGSGRVVPRLDATRTRAMIDSGEITGGMVAKVRGALEAAESAGVPVLVAGWNEPAALARLTHADAPGTRFEPHARLETLRA
jgi:acetylglutamate kinase